MQPTISYLQNQLSKKKSFSQSKRINRSIFSGSLTLMNLSQKKHPPLIALIPTPLFYYPYIFPTIFVSFNK